jgi:hypothetical protein
MPTVARRRATRGPRQAEFSCGASPPRTERAEPCLLSFWSFCGLVGASRLSGAGLSFLHSSGRSSALASPGGQHSKAAPVRYQATPGRRADGHTTHKLGRVQSFSRPEARHDFASVHIPVVLDAMLCAAHRSSGTNVGCTLLSSARRTVDRVPSSISEQGECAERGLTFAERADQVWRRS